MIICTRNFQVQQLEFIRRRLHHLHTPRTALSRAHVLQANKVKRVLMRSLLTAIMFRRKSRPVGHSIY